MSALVDMPSKEEIKLNEINLFVKSVKHIESASESEKEDSKKSLVK